MKCIWGIEFEDTEGSENVARALVFYDDIELFLQATVCS